jgi:cytochrome c551/c552
MSKYTKSAQGKVCQLRLEGCLPSTETVVAAHLNGGGMAAKQSDIHIMYACANCHDIYDGRKTVSPPYLRSWLDDEGRKAVIKTQEIMIKENVLKL